MFMGEYNHNLDDKNRIIIPSKFRQSLGSEFIITKGLDKCLFIYSLKEWEKIVRKLESLPFTKKDARNFVRFFLSGASTCTLDKLGRISINLPLLKYSGINKEAVIIGVNERIEIWNKADFDEFITKNEEDAANISENLFDLDVNL